MSMPHTCVCGICHREMPNPFAGAVFNVAPHAAAAPAPTGEWGVICSAHGMTMGTQTCPKCAAEGKTGDGK